MPTFTVPSLSVSQFYDGTPLGPDSVCIPIFLVVDANGKIASYRGEAVTMADVVAPAASSYGAAQDAGAYSFAPSGTISDDSSGTLKVYHVLSAASVADAAALQAIVGAHGSGYGASNLAYTANASVDLATIAAALRTAEVYEGSAFRAVAEGDAVYSYLLVEDAAGNLRMATTGSLGLVADRTPPRVADFSVSSSNETALTVGWSVSDAGDAAAGAATQLFVNLYASDAAPTPAAVVAGTGALSTAVVADAKTAPFTHTFTGLSAGTPYFAYAAARDAALNLTATACNVSTATIDETEPGNLSAVSVTPAAFDLTWNDLNLITDNVEVTSIDVLYSDSNVLGDASSESVDLSGGIPASFATSTLSDSTTFYCWTRASDAAGNTATAAVTGSPFATLDGTAPTGLASVVVAALSDTEIEFSGLASVVDAGDGLASVDVLYSDSNVVGDASAVSVGVAGGVVTEATKTVSGLTADTTYYTWVRATDLAAAANSVTAATAAPTVATDAAADVGETGYYGTFAENLATDSATVVSAAPVNSYHQHLATDSTGLWLAGAGTVTLNVGPAQLCKWNDATETMDHIGSTGVDGASRTHNYYTMDIDTDGSGVPFVVELVGAGGGTTPGNVVVTKYAASAFSQVGVAQGATYNVKVRHNRSDDHVYVAFSTAAGDIEVTKIAASAGAGTAWTAVATVATGTANSAFGMDYDWNGGILLAHRTATSGQLRVSRVSSGGSVTTVRDVEGTNLGATPQVVVNRRDALSFAWNGSYQHEFFFTQDGGANYTTVTNTGGSHGNFLAIDLNGAVFSTDWTGKVLVYDPVGATTTQIGHRSGGENRSSTMVDQSTGTVVYQYDETQVGFVKPVSTTAVVSQQPGGYTTQVVNVSTTAIDATGGIAGASLVFSFASLYGRLYMFSCSASQAAPMNIQRYDPSNNTMEVMKVTDPGNTTAHNYSMSSLVSGGNSLFSAEYNSNGFVVHRYNVQTDTVAQIGVPVVTSAYGGVGLAVDEDLKRVYFMTVPAAGVQISYVNYESANSSTAWTDVLNDYTPSGYDLAQAHGTAYTACGLIAKSNGDLICMACNKNATKLFSLASGATDTVHVATFTGSNNYGIILTSPVSSDVIVTKTDFDEYAVSTDGGASFAALTNADPQAGSTLNGRDFFFDGAGDLFYETEAGSRILWRYDWSSWSAIATSTFNSDRSACALDPYSGDVVSVGNGTPDKMSVYKSTSS